MIPTAGLAATAIVLATVGRGIGRDLRRVHPQLPRSGPGLDLRPLPALASPAAWPPSAQAAPWASRPSLYLGASDRHLLDRVRRRSGSHRQQGADGRQRRGGRGGDLQAPTTGAVFRPRVVSPTDDNARRRMLLPALPHRPRPATSAPSPCSAPSPFFGGGARPVRPASWVAVVLGLLCGVGARVFAWLIGRAKGTVTTTPAWARVLTAGGLIAALAVASTGSSTSPRHRLGYPDPGWVTRAGSRSASSARCSRSASCRPRPPWAGWRRRPLRAMVIAGAVLGDGLSTVVHDDTTLFPLIGVAAFLGAGYPHHWPVSSSWPRRRAGPVQWCPD